MGNPFDGLDLMATTVLILRIILIPFLLFNISYTWRGFVDILKSKADPTNLYRAVLFLAFVPQLGFNLTALLNAEKVGEGPISLALLLLFFLSNIFAVAGRVLNKYGDFDHFSWLYQGDRLKTAIRAVRLSEVDPRGFYEYLDEAELELIDELVAEDNGNTNNHP